MTVIATDSYGESASIAVTITVTDVNEGPVVTGDVAEYAEDREDAVATFTADDPENAGAVKWTLDWGRCRGLRDRGEQRGADVRRGAKLREWLLTTARTTTMLVTVVATDADGMTTEEMVTVEVTNVDEAGTVSLDKLAPYPGVVPDCYARRPRRTDHELVRSGSGRGRGARTAATTPT